MIFIVFKTIKIISYFVLKSGIPFFICIMTILYVYSYTERMLIKSILYHLNQFYQCSFLNDYNKTFTRTLKTSDVFKTKILEVFRFKTPLKTPRLLMCFLS